MVSFSPLFNFNFLYLLQVIMKSPQIVWTSQSGSILCVYKFSAYLDLFYMKKLKKCKRGGEVTTGGS